MKEKQDYPLLSYFLLLAGALCLGFGWKTGKTDWPLDVCIIISQTLALYLLIKLDFARNYLPKVRYDQDKKLVLQALILFSFLTIIIGLAYIFVSFLVSISKIETVTAKNCWQMFALIFMLGSTLAANRRHTGGWLTKTELNDDTNDLKTET